MFMCSMCEKTVKGVKRRKESCVCIVYSICVGVGMSYKRYHCLNCGRKFSRVHDRRRHEKLVKCEKKEIYNDIEILVRLEKLEKEVNESKMQIKMLEYELLKKRKYKYKNKNIKIIENINIKQKKIFDYGF